MVRLARGLLVTVCLAANLAWAGGGPLGIDHRLSYDDSGIWKRSNQKALVGLLIAGEIGGAVWEGGETRLGKTFWRSIDASLIAGVSAQALKYAFTRARPSQTDDPNAWFQGGSHYSFPSGEVAAVSAVVTPFIMEYARDAPAVYALAVLPVYDAIARVKVQGHWQTDVLAGMAIGIAAGHYAHKRDSPLVLSVMPHAVFVGVRRSW